MRDDGEAQLCLGRVYASNIVISSTIDNRRQCGTAAACCRRRLTLYSRLAAAAAADDKLIYGPSLPRQDLGLKIFVTSPPQSITIATEAVWLGVFSSLSVIF